MLILPMKDFLSTNYVKILYVFLRLIHFVLIFASLQLFALTGKAASSQLISFDLDETLVASDKLLNSDVDKAKKLGFEVKRSVNGQDYILRPGTIELLEFAKGQGFELMVFSHNTKAYVSDILESSGLVKYFTKIKTHEDVLKPYNVDFKKYPNHRNKTLEQDSILEIYTQGLFEGFLVRGFQKMQGNHNIHPYLPCTNCSKYPPIYGARIHIDNTKIHVNKPIDFVGIKVKPFYGLAIEPRNLNGDYIWSEKLEQDLLKLKQIGWVEFYKQKYGKAPNAVPVPVVD